MVQHYASLVTILVVSSIPTYLPTYLPTYNFQCRYSKVALWLGGGLLV